jgi:hypothetical protein
MTVRGHEALHLRELGLPIDKGRSWGRQVRALLALVCEHLRGRGISIDFPRIAARLRAERIVCGDRHSEVHVIMAQRPPFGSLLHERLSNPHRDRSFIATQRTGDGSHISYIQRGQCYHGFLAPDAGFRCNFAPMQRCPTVATCAARVFQSLGRHFGRLTDLDRRDQ